MSNSYRFQSALVGDQWQNKVEVKVCEAGLIESIESDVEGNVPNLVALPGMINVHSHAFQRGFVGLSEFRTAEYDSFWTWREQMYDFVSQMTPERVYSIASQLYGEMLRAGYTWVGEFHYLHHQADGRTHPNIGEMSDAIARAAEDTGIGLCHLPVLYQRGGFKEEPIRAGQDRFILYNDQYYDLFNQCHSEVEGRPNSAIGMAIHSLRAVSIYSMLQTIDHVRSLDPNSPIHIHVAEQLQEVFQCTQANDRRPVQFLYDNLPVDKHWCLIHATHLDDEEMDLVVNSDAVVGLCPTTEANLGDGIFRALDFFRKGGNISIGSDSHCSIDLREELRLLEYGQRLQRLSRAILGTDDVSVGRNLYCKAASGGAQALGINAGEICVGKRADFTLVDPTHPTIDNVKEDRIIDRLIFANIGNPIVGAIVGGKEFV